MNPYKKTAKRRIKSFDSEEVTHERIVKYMRREHSKVIFRTDFAAGIMLPIWLASRQKMLQYKRGFPDLFIYQPTEVLRGAQRLQYFGLAIEIKKVGTRLKRLDGVWASDHIQEQYYMLKELATVGYACAFAAGYDQAVDILEWYLSGATHLEFEDFMLVNYKAPTVASTADLF